jgi:hypothetical protein
MKTLQKIAAVLVFCSVVLFAFSVDAKTVQICDMGAYALYNRANSLFSRHDVPFRFSDLKLWKKASPESPYDQYYVTGFPKGGSARDFVVVVFFCNGAGYVSKMSIMADMDNPNYATYMAYAMAGVTMAMGISVQESDILKQNSHRGKSNTYYGDVWVARLNRRVVCEMTQIPGESGERLGLVHMRATDN